TWSLVEWDRSTASVRVLATGPRCEQCDLEETDAMASDGEVISAPALTGVAERLDGDRAQSRSPESVEPGPIERQPSGAGSVGHGGVVPDPPEPRRVPGAGGEQAGSRPGERHGAREPEDPQLQRGRAVPARGGSGDGLVSRSDLGTPGHRPES